MSVPAENLFENEEREFLSPEFTDKSNVDKPYSEIPDSQVLFKKAIKVIAIGGGGGNALNHIIKNGIDGVDVLALNTDAHALEMSLSEKKIMIGGQTTNGLGAGAVPEVGENAAKESIGEIRDFLKGSDMVYLAAGMGGGTGTGAIPVIARAAREMGILTVAVVTKPFGFEGKRRSRYAEEGILKLSPEVDALIVVPNDKLLEICPKGTTMINSFRMADEILRQAVQGVTDLITRPGIVNVDFADLRTILRNSGRSVMGIGSASGEDSAARAVRSALESPLMECSMSGAKGVLMNITYKNDISILEISAAAESIEEVISPDAQFIWGCVSDSKIDNDVEVTLVAAGFDEEAIPARGAGIIPEERPRQSASKYREPRSIETAPIFTPEPEQYRAYEEPTPAQSLQYDEPQQHAEPEPIPAAYTPAWLLESDPEPEEPEDKQPLQDKYDIPTFIRRGKHFEMPQ